MGPLVEETGLPAVSKDPSDKGKFRTPSLYDCASPALFVHDGAFSTLKQVIERYNRSRAPAAHDHETDERRAAAAEHGVVVP